MKLTVKKYGIITGIVLFSIGIIANAQTTKSELESAYNYWVSAGIISTDSYTNANMLAKVSRKDAAKMFVLFANRVNTWMKKDTTINCTFLDITNESSDTQEYIQQACQLWIMGRNNNGTVTNTFKPSWILTRGQVWTIISRILYGTKYNWGKKFYTNHLQILSKDGVIKNISKPDNAELRWYILTMMMRAEQIRSKKWEPNQNPPKSWNNQKPPQTGNSQKPPQTGNNQSTYNIEQAISDNAQLSTLAFDGLGFLAGNLCSDTFLPPGKVADFFGFQYLRDTTQAGKWHSTDFVTNAANNVLNILNDSQKAKMIALAKAQADTVNQYAYDRLPLMKAFRRALEWDIPRNTKWLSKTAIMSYSANLYELDAKISIQRAQLFAEIIKSLSASQITSLNTMVKWWFASRAALPDQVDKTTLTHDQHVLVMTYASEMFGRYAGDIEADTYFCPERQWDYFGGFYIKDAPAIGNAWYTIDESITWEKWKKFLDILSSTQKPIITSIVDLQRTAINGIVEKRRAIATELRKYRWSSNIDENTVISLARQYGELDGEISYYYAANFVKVGNTLTSTQKQQLEDLKDLNGYSCEWAYIYSNKISTPTIPNTDFLFD